MRGGGSMEAMLEFDGGESKVGGLFNEVSCLD
jgi:hypothetical protein